MNKVFEKSLFYLYGALVFFTPLIFSFSTEEHYEFPKIIFLYCIGASIILIYFLRNIIYYQKPKVKVDLFVSIFVGILILSTMLSSHFYTSLWGYYSRFNEGLVSVLILYGIYFVGINFLDKSKVIFLKELLGLTLLPLSAFGIYQAFSITRVYASLGQPNWFAAYIVFILPLVIQNYVFENEKIKKFLWLGISFISILALWLTHSLSGIVALASLVLFLFLKHSKRKVKFFLIGVVFLFVVLVASFGYLRERVRDAVNFSADASTYNVSDSGLIRIGLWRGTFRMIISSPKVALIGSGPETFPYEFPFFRDPILNSTSEWAYILNKPHNYYLEIAAESGIFSLILYLIIVVRLLRSGNKYMSAGLLGYLVTNIFGWPTVSTSILFWMWLVFIKVETSE